VRKRVDQAGDESVKCPILMLTARGEVVASSGLECGTDDFPFDLAELRLGIPEVAMNYNSPRGQDGAGALRRGSTDQPLDFEPKGPRVVAPSERSLLTRAAESDL
jgi:DNA-binding response OmpR family regulator